MIFVCKQLTHHPKQPHRVTRLIYFKKIPWNFSFFFRFFLFCFCLLFRNSISRGQRILSVRNSSLQRRVYFWDHCRRGVTVYSARCLFRLQQMRHTFIILIRPGKHGNLNEDCVRELTFPFFFHWQNRSFYL